MTEHIDQHYDDPENRDVVEKRFAVYDFAEPRVDIHNEEAKVLSFLGKLANQEGNINGPIVLDVGSSKGGMLARLMNHGFRGGYIGLDRSYNQLKQSKDQHLFPPLHMLPLNAKADILPILDKTVDISLVNFMLYHQDENARWQTYSELKRVTKSDGLLVIGTSGVTNKALQRRWEFDIANDLGPPEVLAPPPMNLGFTSEKAMTELPENFPGWHLATFEQVSQFPIRDEKRVDACINSIRTLRDQYTPEPTEVDFEASLAKVKARLMQFIDDGSPLVDSIQRTFIVASPTPLGLPGRVVLR